MKKIITLFLLFTNIALMAQASQGFNYQGTVRNSNGQLIINQSVIFKFVLLQNSATGQVIYSETHSVITDDLGGASLIIGTGSPLTGSFSLINWASGTYYMGIELNTGNGFIAMGITQLLSVPYALYSLDSGSTKKTSLLLTGNITDAEAAAKIALEVGPDTKSIYIIETTVLTTVDLSRITEIVDLKIVYNASLRSLNFAGVKGIYSDEMPVKFNPLLSSISFPSCKIAFGHIEINDNNSLTTISFPVLTLTQYVRFKSNPELRSIELPILKKSEDLSIFENNKLSSVNFPSLLNYGELSIYSNASLSFVSIPAISTGTYLNIRSNKLSSSQINAILQQLLTVAPFSGKYINLDDQNPLAPPTGQGIIDKNLLIANGNSVNTD